jgi:hypothetical protein
MVVSQETDGMGFRGERILAWLNPEAHASGKGFQTLQALYAIGSGGIFGKGLGQSMQKLGFIPEAQNDMIFSIICEELGLFGAISIILLFMILVWRCVVIANNASDMFGALLVVGVMGHLIHSGYLKHCSCYQHHSKYRHYTSFYKLWRKFYFIFAIGDWFGVKCFQRNPIKRNIRENRYSYA